MIIVVDYGIGNLSSVSNMIRKSGGEVCISGDPDKIITADKLLLPGVGHFDHGMKMFNSSGIRDAVERFALDLKKPVLGICLGAQIMGMGSEEGCELGLGWIDMQCRRLPLTPGLRVPHMGWNQIVCNQSSPLFDQITEDARFYFVHSYYMDCAKPDDVLATATHGIDFACAVRTGNIYGTQFHPEKSLRHGLTMMKAFVEMELS
jgi:glutamine amidotransferase